MKNKKTIIIAFVAVAIITLIGSTLAYFASTVTVQNTYSASSYETVVERNLGGLSGIQPNEYIYLDKLKVKNQGSNRIAVRAKITGEYFIEESNKAGLTGASKETVAQAATPELNKINPQTGEPAMMKIIGAYWQYNSQDGWYYYNDLVNPNESTTTDFIDTLWFNSKATNNSNCYYATISNGDYIIDSTKKANAVDGLESGNVICVSEEETGKTNYANVDYKLYVTFETIQGSAVNSIWGNSVPSSATKLISEANSEEGKTSKSDPLPPPYLQPLYFAFGNPTTEDTTPPTGKNVYIGMDENGRKGVCINRGGNRYCFKTDDVAYEKEHAQEVFSDITCNTSSGASCIATDFYVYIRPNGTVYVKDYINKESCNLLINGNTDCTKID